MRQIGTFAAQDQATVFTNFLVARGISAICEEGQGTWEVWVRDEDRVTESRDALERFQKNPQAVEYREATTKADQVRTAERERRQRAAANTVQVRKQVFRRSLGKRAPLTMVLVGLSILTALATQLGEDRDSLFLKQFGFVNAAHLSEPGFSMQQDGMVDVRRGEIWRVVTPIFLHFGLPHLVFNMWWLIALGSQIETRQGSTWLAIIVLASGIAGNVGQFFFAGPLFGGMSGVIYGLFGYILVRMLHAPREGLVVGRETIFIMALVLILGFTGALDSIAGGAIANWAHLFGLLGGIAVALLKPIPAT